MRGEREERARSLNLNQTLGSSIENPKSKIENAQVLPKLTNKFTQEDVLTTTADKILPCTITGSWPRPRWFDLSMWGRPLDSCMMDTRYREKFQDALATVLSDQERAGLDILTHG